jgi:CHASE3 domain sensor protein
VRAGLTRRTLLASAILALIVGGAFAVMRAAVEDGRRTTRLARHSRAELETVDRLAQMIVDAETGARGFVITRQDRFLQPWQAARANFPAVAASLGAFADDPVQIPRAHAIARAGTS